MTEWTAPWMPGLPLATCVGCGERVVAVTLTPFDQCVQCAKDQPTDDAGQMRLR
jgi:hypothetical protein